MAQTGVGTSSSQAKKEKKSALTTRLGHLYTHTHSHSLYHFTERRTYYKHTEKKILNAINLTKIFFFIFREKNNKWLENLAGKLPVERKYKDLLRVNLHLDRNKTCLNGQ